MKTRRAWQRRRLPSWANGPPRGCRSRASGQRVSRPGRQSMSTDNRRSPRRGGGTPSPWINKPRNVEQPFQRLYSIANPPRPNPDFFGDLQLTVAALQGLIGDAIRDQTTLRAIGGGWSLSEAAVTDGRMIGTFKLNWLFPVGAPSGVPGSPGPPPLPLYLQCGVLVRATYGR